MVIEDFRGSRKYCTSWSSTLAMSSLVVVLPLDPVSATTGIRTFCGVNAPGPSASNVIFHEAGSGQEATTAASSTTAQAAPLPNASAAYWFAVEFISAQCEENTALTDPAGIGGDFE